MRLRDWLNQQKLSDADFGVRIGAARQVVHRYKTGVRMPEKDAMERIVEATGGAVTPNDFFALSTPHPENAGLGEGH